MIRKEQIRAARAYLGWDRERLAEESGVSVAQIASYEGGRTKDPRQQTLEAIEIAFRRNGVIFKDGGIAPRLDCTTRYEGEGWYLRLLDDVYEVLKDERRKEVIVLNGDESRSSPEVLQRWKKIRGLGVKMRRVVREGDTHLLGPLEEYRYMPEKFFDNNVIIVYANNVAICTQKNTMAMAFEDAPLAKNFRHQADFYFETLQTPTVSIAHEK